MGRQALCNREQILANALEPFWRNGYEATSLRQLEEATGLNPGSLYHHFDSKEHLFREVLAYYIKHRLLPRLGHYLEHNPPLEGLRLFFSTSYRQQDVQHYRCGCLLVVAMLEGQRPAISTLIRSALEQLETRFATALAQAGKAEDNCRLLMDNYLALQLSGHLLGNRKTLDSHIRTIFEQLPAATV